MDRLLAQFDDVTEVATATPGAAAWTARERGDGRRVLIKRLPDDEFKTRATQSLALRHARIAPTRCWLRDEDHFYVVRDFVPGGNLRQTLGDLSLRAFDRLRALLDPILDALDYAHQLGLAHGGVTPENVVVAGGGALLTDFATIDNRNGAHQGYVPRVLLAEDREPTPRADYYALCELYKEFLPARSVEDEAGSAARSRLLRNLTEMQQTCASADELRYKLDAVTRMAELLGFSSRGLPEDAAPRPGARLVCAISPPTATLTPGGGTTVTLTVRNEGGVPLQIEGVGSDVVWANSPSRFAPFSVAPDTSQDLIFTLSGARLQPGSYIANLLIRSNSEMQTLSPPEGMPWHEQRVALPVLVTGPGGGAPQPLAENLPAAPLVPTVSSTSGGAADQSGIAVTQEPDPGLVRYGQIGIIHLGVKNIGRRRLRVDKVSTWPPWLVYPGDFQPVWIEPDATQYLGFSVLSATLTGGDYKGEVTFIASLQTETLLGLQPVWREMKCDVRVRVVRSPRESRPGVAGPNNAGCVPVLLALLSPFAVIGFWLLSVWR